MAQFVFKHVNLGQDPVVKEVKESVSSPVFSEDKVMVFLSVAENRSRFNKDTGEFEKLSPEWFEVSCFGGLAKKASFLKKGDLVRIEGVIRPYSIKKEDEEYSQTTLKLTAKEIEKVTLIETQESKSI